MRKVLTNSEQETKELAFSLGQELLNNPPLSDKALIIALIGNLGSGKTSFSQSFAMAIGIKEKIKSPTFLIFKKYNLKDKNFANFFHIDAYRIQKPADLNNLGLENIFNDKKNIALIEWADNIKEFLPKEAILITFKHLKGDKRLISIKQYKMWDLRNPT